MCTLAWDILIRAKGRRSKSQQAEAQPSPEARRVPSSYWGVLLLLFGMIVALISSCTLGISTPLLVYTTFIVSSIFCESIVKASHCFLKNRVQALCMMWCVFRVQFTRGQFAR